MKLIKKLLTFLKSFTGILVIIGVVLLIFFLFIKEKKPAETILVLTRDNLATTGITLGGTVIPQKEVELSFQNSGRIAQVFKDAGSRVSQGEELARLSTSTISADISKAQADLNAEIAKLEEIKYQEKITDSGVVTKRAQLLREMQNAYVVAEDAVMNKTDAFFEDPRSYFPKIYPLFTSGNLRTQINQERYAVGILLSNWSSYSRSLNSNFTDQDIINVQNNIRAIQKYLDLVATAVNQFSPQEDISGRTQTNIDTYRINTSTARSNLNTSLSNVIEKQETLRPNASSIPFQESRVAAARAQIQSLEAILEKSIIRAPFEGLITKQNAKVGTSAFSDQNVITLISDSNYAIEAYIPEIYIAQIMIGTKAKVSLNPYGKNELFDATVSYIDPAASRRDGVASYKIELTFDSNDERINAGMTADIQLIIDQAQDSFWIPSEAIIDQNGTSYVKLRVGESVELRKIELGERTPEKTEVLRGLIIGDKIIIESKK
jgi:multidrug efflux pump subunit AcrA (membrane-fusion protein)